MDKFIPKSEVRKRKRNFQPFTAELHKLINKKCRLWNRWISTRDEIIFNKYKITRNKVKRETVKLLQQEQHKISLERKTNPKKFWQYVNSRSKTKTGVSDLKWDDDDGKEVIAETDLQKALLKYFSCV